MGRRRKKRARRGYPVAIMVSIAEKQEGILYFWNIFSERVKIGGKTRIGKKWKNASEKDRYHLFESVVNYLRPHVRQGIKAVGVLQPPNVDFFSDFEAHIQRHHRWLRKSGRHRIKLVHYNARVASLDDMAALYQTEEFSSFLEQILYEEGEMELSRFNSLLNDPEFSIYYTLEEGFEHFGDARQRQSNFEYIFMTSQYRDKSPKKQRLQHFLQISANSGVQIKTFAEENPMSDRLQEFGGLVIFEKSQSAD